MPEPAVYAIVVNWNGTGVLEPCLRTLLASSYPRLSVVVVDNASTDGSQDLVRRAFPSARLVENEANLGYAGGANVGLGLALEDGADYALLMNNDVEIAPDAVSALVDAARDRATAGLLGPMIYYHDRPDVIWSAGGRVSYWTGRIYHRGIREKDEGQYGGLEETDYLTGCAVMITAEALRSVGPLDVNYLMYNEDTDWCVRAAKNGYGVVLVPDAKLWHKVSMSSGGGLTPFKTYHRLRSTLRFFGIHARPYHWLGIVPVTLVRMVGFFVAQLTSGRAANAAAVARGVFDSVVGRGRGLNDAP